jgi:dienelactone hydrolase
MLFNGFDGSMEEIYHLHGTAALERGYNVVVFEGPGQPTVRRDQDIGFTHEWEKVVTPVVDFLSRQPEVDMSKLGLLGYSLGGLLCLRAAAFEPRIAAVFAIDGIYDFSDTPIVRALERTRHLEEVSAVQAFMSDIKIPTSFRWALGHGLYSFNVQTPAELLDRVTDFTLRGLEDKIQCAIYIGEAEKDHFFGGAAKATAEALGTRATLVELTDEDGGAGAHCHCGASRLASAVMYDWFEVKVVRH